MRLVHRTRYAYAEPVQLGPQTLRLRPLPDPGRPPPHYTLRIDPAPLTLHWLVDPAGNPVVRFALAAPTTRLSIEVEVELDLTPRNPFDFVLDDGAESWPFAYPDPAPLLPYMLAGPTGAGMAAMRRETVAGTHTTLDLLRALAEQVRSRLTYVVRTEQGTWEPERTLDEGTASCRDSAWLLVALLRSHGFAARFVSGYLIQRPPDKPASAELHAWAEAYLPGAGWLGLDATSGAIAAEEHIALAAAPSPAGAAPLSGTMPPVDAVLETEIVLDGA